MPIPGISHSMQSVLEALANGEIDLQALVSVVTAQGMPLYRLAEQVRLCLAWCLWGDMCDVLEDKHGSHTATSLWTAVHTLQLHHVQC